MLIMLQVYNSAEGVVLDKPGACIVRAMTVCKNQLHSDIVTSRCVFALILTYTVGCAFFQSDLDLG